MNGADTAAKVYRRGIVIQAMCEYVASISRIANVMALLSRSYDSTLSYLTVNAHRHSYAADEALVYTHIRRASGTGGCSHVS